MVRSNLNALLSEHVVCCSRDQLRDYHPHWFLLPEELSLTAGAWSATDVTSKDYNSHASLRLGKRNAISNVGFSRFARRYSGNPRWFLFLRWLRCFSSAGNLAWFEIQKKRFVFFFNGQKWSKKFRWVVSVKNKEISEKTCRKRKKNSIF